MGKIEKLIRASEKVQLPEQQTYVLAGAKLYYLMQFALIGLFLVMTNRPLWDSSAGYTVPTYMIYCSIFAGIYGLACIIFAFTCKVTIDDEKMTIPGKAPFTKETLYWEQVDKAKVVGTITYNNYLVLILKKILSIFFLSIELHVNYKNIPSGDGIEFPVFARISDRATALYLIRQKLGNRMKLYKEENDNTSED